MAGVGEFLVSLAHRRGMFLYVAPDGRVWYWPKRLMTPDLLRLLNAHYLAVKRWLVTDSVTQE